jgi:hypothetical protein
MEKGLCLRKPCVKEALAGACKEEMLTLQNPAQRIMGEHNRRAFFLRVLY